MGKILIYTKTNILVRSSKIMHVIHTHQDTTHINLGSRQSNQISLSTMFGVSGFLKKGIWNVNVRSRPWWIMWRTSNFIIKKNRKKVLRWQVYIIEKNFETLKLNNEYESIDLNFGLDIEACTIDDALSSFLIDSNVSLKW